MCAEFGGARDFEGNILGFVCHCVILKNPSAMAFTEAGFDKRGVKAAAEGGSVFAELLIDTVRALNYSKLSEHL
jgi:hypothetical protein